MPQANLFDFIPEEGIPGVDTDPLKMDGFDNVVFNDGGGSDQPLPNQVPIQAQRPTIRQPDAVSSSFLNTGIPQHLTDLAATLVIPPQILFQGLY